MRCPSSEKTLVGPFGSGSFIEMTGYNDFGGSNSCVALGIRGNGYSALRHRGLLDNGKSQHIAFGGLRVDDAIEAALLQLVGPAAITAAIVAEAEAAVQRDQVQEALLRDLEAARYAADRAFRQYDAADPANRLVAAELEARWNRT